jgi:methyl-accepting chemotaxis protein
MSEINSQMKQNAQILKENSEKIDQIVDKSEELKQSSSNFLEMTK